MGEINETSNHRKSIPYNLIISLCLYFGSFAIHLILAQNASIFNLTPDEYSVTAVAAYLNGLDWSSTVSTGGYYGYFQSLFYVPVFWITDDPYLRYQVMLGINGALMSFVPVIIHHLCYRQFQTGRLAAVILSIVCGLYPCYLLLTKYTWNETLCYLLPWIFILLIYKSAECKSLTAKQAFSALGGFVTVAAYATHGRMLAMLAAAIVTVLLTHFLLKKQAFCLSGFFISTAVTFVADLLIKKHLQNALWLVAEKESPPINTIEKMLDRLFSADAEAIGYFFSALAGHLYYFITATWGFGPVCIVLIISACVQYVRSRIKNTEVSVDDNTSLLCIFALLIMGAIFAVSVLFKCTSSLIDERMDSAIYGRYTEAFYPIAILATLILIYQKRISLRDGFASMFTAVIINVLVLSITRPLVTGGSRFVCAMILGIAPMRFGENIRSPLTDETFIKLSVVSLAGALVFSLLTISAPKFKHGYLLVSLPLAALLGFSSISNYNSYVKPQYKNSQSGATYMQQAIDLVADEYNKLYLCGITKERYVKAQFIYPEKELDITSKISSLSTLDERPEILLANNDYHLHLWLDGVYLINDINEKVHVYACTETAMQWAVDNGFNVTGNSSASYSAVTLLDNGPVIHNLNSVSIPSESSVYTNYMLWHSAASLEVTITGDGVEAAQISVTADKGKTEIPYLVSHKSSGSITIKINTPTKLENARIEIKNKGLEIFEVNSLTIKRISDSPAKLPPQ